MSDKIILPIIYALSFAVLMVVGISFSTSLFDFEISSNAENINAFLAGVAGSTIKLLHIV